MDFTPDDLGQGPAAPEQVDGDGAESNLDAMADLLAGAFDGGEGEGPEDVAVDGEDAAADDGFMELLGEEPATAKTAGRAADKPYDEMSDAELTDAVQGMSPSQLRSAILRQRDYTRKTQEVADRRRELDGRESALYQRATEAQQTAPMASPQPVAPVQKLTIQDCLDEYGALDLEKFQKYEAQRDAAINEQVEAALKPVGEKLSQREEAELAARAQSVTDTFDSRLAKMRETFPGWTPAVEQSVVAAAAERVQVVGAENILGGKIKLDPMLLYAELYPREWGRVVVKADQAKAKRATNKEQAPATPPGRSTGGKSSPPLDGDARLDAMAARLQAGGVGK